MPKKKVRKFEAWSFSRWSDYEKCAFMAFCKYLDPNKPKFVPNKAMQRGTDIHTKAEKYATGVIRKLPKELELFEDEFKALRKIKKKLKVEGQLTITADWEETGWFDRDAWLRVKMDLMYNVNAEHLKMIDHKTGRIRPEHENQLSLYALIGFVLFDEVEKIDAELWYLDEGEIIPFTYLRKDFNKLKKAWEKRTKKMLTDTVFKPTPGNGCTWCDFSAAKGGPCKY